MAIKINTLEKKEIQIRDLEYEIRLLLGAKEIITFIRDWDNSRENKFGNLVNYFKDSAYIHIRNIYKIFRDRPCINNITVPQMNLEKLSSFINPVEKFVMHLNTGRDKRSVSNIRKGIHINERISEAVLEIEELWQELTNSIKEPSLAKELRNSLARAKRDALNDTESLATLLTKK